MNIKSITLNSNGQRYKTFLQNNSHLEIEPFEGIKGNNLSTDDILKENIATKELISNKKIFSPGGMGCAASHKKIWHQCLLRNQSILVLEDDCYTHPQIKEFINFNEDILNANDICFFGLHMNSVLQTISPQGLEFNSIFFDPAYPNPSWIKNAFLKTEIKNIIFNKLINDFGTFAYYITPKGAEKLINLIFPLSLKTTKIKLLNDRMPLFSIDRAGCAIYRDINALVTYPYLAYNQNITKSTTEPNI
tara:strand:- start:108 stop:851 length:744 start_codon:yes stop_codon:yes gene_type:complete